MLTFAGEGYSKQFVTNFERIARRIASGAHIAEIVFGPDDICAPILDDSSCHCRNASIRERDRLAAQALTNLLHQPVKQGAMLDLSRETLDLMRSAFAAGTIRKACVGCQWSGTCDSIAEAEFRQSALVCGIHSRHS